MRYADINLNDTANGPGVCVSIWLQGCGRHCKGCFNPQTWDFEGGKPFGMAEMQKILKGISANGILRNVNILGGEPMAEQNLFTTAYIVSSIREWYGNSIEIYLWSGYTLQELKDRESNAVNSILDDIDVLIDGPFEEDKKDLTLYLRGSSNQTIHYLKK